MDKINAITIEEKIIDYVFRVFSENVLENPKKLRKSLQSLTSCNIIIKVLFAEVRMTLGVQKKNPPALKREVATRPDALPRTSVTEIFVELCLLLK
ncbi:hypothetical protein [Enterococcus xiangfangensis]|uniref:Transposase n=1 Tax=Enterococcus xiangfangensis TaxID=1296537 RepID=A0ABU3FC67_9ENTE|nr:hypothetical protein [Enterococcus xiangfangensis]MBM7711922.1 hypothetical protein [Enterococcus xiangfangensis]MDT2759996.1 hypothetical protein [Enterococcus xiangfangensis]